MRPVLDIPYSPESYTPVDLGGLDATQVEQTVMACLRQPGVRVAYGGYLEARNLYAGFTHFDPGSGRVRNIHLGLDLWAPAGTAVLAPESGKVHSWDNRTGPGDYGGIVLLEHPTPNGVIFTLYGHLSPESLQGLTPGCPFVQGEVIGSLGTPSENGGYFPHLHFQVIRNLEGYRGDYPGVCCREELDHYRTNCPDPIPYLGL